MRTTSYLIIATSIILFIAAHQSHAQNTGFTGPFAPGNWTPELPDPSFGGEITEFTENTLIIEGPDGINCFDLGGAEVSVSIEIPADLLISFEWSYFSSDGGQWDIFIVRRTANGDITEVLTVPNVDQGDGTFDALFDKGDEIDILVYSRDCRFGPGILTVTNFNYQELAPVPVKAWSFLMAAILMATFAFFRFKA